MTLASQWTTRVSSAKQVELTNPDNNPAGTVDAARLAAAAADAQAEWQQVTGLAYDDTNAAHVASAVPGVTVYLYESRGISTTGALGAFVRESWERKMRRMVSIPALTTSGLDPSKDPTGDGQVLPQFDDQAMSNQVPRAPQGGSQVGPFGPFGPTFGQ